MNTLTESVEYALRELGVPMSDQLARALERTEKEIETLRSVCAEAYQMAGALDAPEEALDNLLAASAGEPIPHGSFLPVIGDGFPEITDDMVLSFHHALTDAPIGQHEVDEIKIGLRAALAAAPKQEGE
jgi:hypothetical protein